MKKEAPATKICSCCGKRKRASQFGNNPRTKTGLKSYCRPCSAIKQRESVARLALEG